MSDILTKVWRLFTTRERWQVSGLLALAVLTGVLDMLGVASILPFLSLLSQPEMVRQNAYMNSVYDALGFTSTQAFLFFLGCVVLALMVLTNTLLALSTWLMAVFTWNKQHSLSTFLLEGYLARPYVSFLNRNSADPARNILVETFNFALFVLAPLSDIFSTGVSILLILTLLVLVNPALALGTAVTLGGAYGLIYLALRRRIAIFGKRVRAEDILRFKTINEALGGIKDLKILGREDEFVERYAIPSKAHAKVRAEFTTVRELPRYVLETLAFGGILLMVLYLMAVQGDVRAIIPVVGLYAFAGYRLLPSLKDLFKALSQLRFQKVTVDTIARELEESQAALAQKHKTETFVTALPFKHAIELRGIGFNYPGSKLSAVQNINVVIPHNQAVAFTGPTGAGKTTLVDILLGLLTPSCGCLTVDGIPVTEDNLRNWQQNIGYVPQSIYLCDDTITRNIAFGIPGSKIDAGAVERAAKIANLHDFILNDLPAGYETIVGERGVRLSGGQRQRIGIARALYHDPAVLVFDEATSALDGVTEDAVLEAIGTLASTKTLIMIAHRLSSVRACDVIYLIDRGHIVAHGSYDDLVISNNQFRALANLAHGHFELANEGGR